MPWTVSTLSDCKACGQPIDRTRNKRLRAFCSSVCRSTYTIKESNRKRTASGASREYQRLKASQNATESSTKKKCGICGLWYRRVGHHIRQRHGMSAREYRQEMNLPISRGIMTPEAREHMRSQALINNMDKHLPIIGTKTRYTKNDPKAKKSHPLAGVRTPESDYF